MKNDSPASLRGASVRIQERTGRKCHFCGAVHGAMVTLGVHLADAKGGGRAHPEAAWLDHWRGTVHAREDGRLLEGGRFIVLQRPMKVALQLPAQGGAGSQTEEARALCQWHYRNQQGEVQVEGGEGGQRQEEP